MVDMRDNAEVTNVIERAHYNSYPKILLIRAFDPKISAEFYLNSRHIDRKCAEL